LASKGKALSSTWVATYETRHSLEIIGLQTGKLAVLGNLSIKSITKILDFPENKHFWISNLGA